MNNSTATIANLNQNDLASLVMLIINIITVCVTIPMLICSCIQLSFDYDWQCCHCFKFEHRIRPPPLKLFYHWTWLLLSIITPLFNIIPTVSFGTLLVNQSTVMTADAWCLWLIHTTIAILQMTRQPPRLRFKNICYFALIAMHIIVFVMDMMSVLNIFEDTRLKIVKIGFVILVILIGECGTLAVYYSLKRQLKTIYLVKSKDNMDIDIDQMNKRSSWIGSQRRQSSTTTATSTTMLSNPPQLSSTSSPLSVAAKPMEMKNGRVAIEQTMRRILLLGVGAGVSILLIGIIMIPILLFPDLSTFITFLIMRTIWILSIIIVAILSWIPLKSLSSLKKSTILMNKPSSPIIGSHLAITVEIVNNPTITPGNDGTPIQTGSGNDVEVGMITYRRHHHPPPLSPLSSKYIRPGSLTPTSPVIIPIMIQQKRSTISIVRGRRGTK